VPFRDESAAGIGLATYDDTHRVLDAWYPQPTLGTQATDPIPALKPAIDELRGVKAEPVETHIASLAEPPTDAIDAYLRLHLLSHRLIRPNEANLDGLFGLLTNVAWTSLGPVAADEVEAVRLRARSAGERLEVYGVDKFPRMTDYVVPSGVRIADADRVRLGAYLGSGTTVMHEGFVNFNAGTLGTSMVEGRISAGVVVGDGTDVGGGASIIGTLSGGGQIVVSLGERCLLGANSGIGIPLGDDCVVEAGCYVTSGAKLLLPDGEVVRARDLAGVSGMLFWRNSTTGALEARPRTGSWGGLNAALHAQ
jgi:2,3,4,5-tetrahydropyridine-2,6-dicarboxylate N-succinyltransferase